MPRVSVMILVAEKSDNYIYLSKVPTFVQRQKYIKKYCTTYEIVVIPTLVGISTLH